MTRLTRRQVLAATLALAASTRVHAQAFPSQPIRIIVGYSAGGAVDIIARAVGQHLQASLGQPVIDERRDRGAHPETVAVNALEVLPHVKAGKLRVLAVLSEKRSPIFPDAPAIAESGFPGFEASVWYGVVGPAGMPPAVVARLHQEVQRALAAPEVRERLASAGGDVMPGAAAMFADLLRREQQRYEKLIRQANIKPD